MGLPLRSGKPGAPRTGPPCEGGQARLSEWVCEAHPEARASWSGGFARPAARTLRLPALHRGTQYEGRRSPAAPFRVMSTEQAHRGY
jgi:hypothetical protein